VSFNANGIVAQDKHFNILKAIDFPKINLISVSEFNKLALRISLLLYLLRVN
jgi:hypothetical protein